MNSLILSAALDTNGQNARYVRASQRWGSDPDVLKALVLGKYDPASVMGRFQEAAEKFGELKIRSAHHSQHMYQQMPADIVWNRQTHRQIVALAKEADVVHLNNSIRAWRMLNPGFRKPFLLHHHGTMLRGDPGGMVVQARNLKATQAVSTVDLLRHAADGVLHWLPTAYDVDWLESFGAEHRRDSGGPIRIVSAPTNRAYKSTALLEATVAQLISEGLDIELVLIEERPWAEGMALKATADIYFDQIAIPALERPDGRLERDGYPGGYGCNAIEAWGMGIPVIAGADEWTSAKMREIYGGTLPFYEATTNTLGDAIRTLATSKAARTKWAKAGMRHIRKFHDEKPALRRLAELYHLTLSEAPSELLPLPPATFTATTPQIHIASRYLNFPYTTDNPYLANRIRLYAQRFPKHGITEVVTT
jgi:hypothetical protein